MANGYRRVLDLIEARCYAGTDAFYSSPEMADAVGEGERVIVHAPIMRIGTATALGTTMNVSVWLYAEDSSDALSWAQIGSGAFASDNIERRDLPTAIRGVVDFPHGRYLRIKMKLGGSNPTAWIGVRATVKPYEGE